MRTFEITVVVTVTNESSLRAFAEDRYEKAWRDTGLVGAALEACVIEALVLSNDNPSPDEYGINIDSWSVHEKRRRVRKCRRCHASFAVHDGRQVYCTRKCGNADRAQRLRDRRTP